MPLDELWWLLLPVLAIDGARYCFLAIGVWCCDLVKRLRDRVLWHACGVRQEVRYEYAPSVSLIIAGLNEADCLDRTLRRVWNSYPNLQVIVVDDGSTDGMSEVANQFAKDHPDLVIITKPRGGKSSAMNAGLPYVKHEVVIIVDADSELSETAIWEIVQPLADPQVGAVSGNVSVRNSEVNLLTRIQAFEYMRSIFLGRIVLSKLGILGIVSGAFGAFRKSLLVQMGGWDVGPGEDEDLILRIRKLGYRVEFAPYADCYTDCPDRWKVLTKQRRRWEWAVVTFESRKHIDMANPFHRHFRWSNFFLFVERWVYNLLFPLWMWVYLAWMVFVCTPPNIGYAIVLYYLLYLAGDTMQLLLAMDYAVKPSRYLHLAIVLPLMPIYQAYQRIVTTIALLEEIFTRRSFRDGFVPKHVREATWHW